MELNQKIYKIYAEGNKSIKLTDAKKVFVIRNGEANGATLYDVFRKVDEFETNKIWGWSLLEFYKAKDGFLVDSEGNKISLLEGETKIFFKGIDDPFLDFSSPKDVNLDYIKDVSTLLGLGAIEETITDLTNEEKQVLVEDRMTANEKRQQQIKKEKEDADAQEKKALEAERKKIEAEQKEEADRLKALEEEAAEAKKKEDEEKEKSEKEAKKIEAEKKKQEEEEKEKAEEERKKKEREENENVYSPKQYKELRAQYLETGFTEHLTNDEKYTLFFPEEVTKENKPFVIVKTKIDYEDLEGELTINNDKQADFEFTENGEEKIITLNKKTDSVKVRVIA